MAALGAPVSSAKSDVGSGVRAVIVAPTRELAHQIHNECLKLAVGRKWRIILFSKSTASTLADKSVRDKIGSWSRILIFAVLYRHRLISPSQISLSVRPYGWLLHSKLAIWSFISKSAIDLIVMTLN